MWDGRAAGTGVPSDKHPGQANIEQRRTKTLVLFHLIDFVADKG